jgi:hypothetical protein
MKIMRSVLAAVILLAACDAHTTRPVAPTPAARDVGVPSPPQNAAPCDSACLAKSPFMGGGGS